MSDEESETGDKGEGEQEVVVATLLDESTTNNMHDDTTMLRKVPVLQEGDGLEILGALRIWVGGAVQYDYFNFDGIHNYTGGGERRDGGTMRSLEGTFRSQLYDWGEIKAQYDFNRGFLKDLYLRWVSERTNTPVTVTVGNQSEPIGLDDTVGNKFGIAQESSAPSHAFGSWRSQGVRLHRAFQLDKVDRKLDIYEDETAFVTTSIGVFTKDIEETHQTDFAVTARLTGGGGWGRGDLHLGLSGSYREGEFRRISFRPEVAEADRITLARPEANTLGIAGLEGAYNRGPFHLQAEGYYAQYQGKVDGYGGGSYIQAGWFLTGDSRDYNARWGILAPHKPAGKYSVEVFGRISHTRGDDDANGWNDYKSVTLGCSLFFRRLRGSVNVVYAETREPIDGEHDGIAINVRGQILF